MNGAGWLDTPESFLDVFLQPGEIYWGSENTRMRTLLGSCVAIVLWHPVRHTGGMCHYLLPHEGEGPRYARGAIEVFQHEMRQSRTPPSEYIARVFGGGNMFVREDGSDGQGHVGQANVDVAFSLLREMGIRVVAADTGGRGYRKLIFDLWSGSVWMKKNVPAPVPRRA